MVTNYGYLNIDDMEDVFNKYYNYLDFLLNNNKTKPTGTSHDFKKIIFKCSFSEVFSSNPA